MIMVNKDYHTNKHNKTNTIRVYQQKHNGQPCIRMCLQSELTQPNCTRLKISFLICLTEHLVTQI